MRLTRKQFLSDSPDETGFIVITAATCRLEDMNDYEAKSPNVSAEVQVGDCSKKVYLDFNIYKDKDVKKRIDKLNVLIDNLIELRESLPDMWQDAQVNAQVYKLNKEIEEKEDEKSVG